MMTEENNQNVSSTNTCTTCYRLRICAIFYLFLYLLDICTDLILAWHYYVIKNLEDSITTFIFVVLPFFATILVNYFEENLKVDVSRGCFHYIGFLPPRSKCKKFELHKEKHRVEGDENAIVLLERKSKAEEINAVILQDIAVCFESAPQLIFQLSTVFRDMSTFDGELDLLVSRILIFFTKFSDHNLISAINLTNGFKICCLFSSTFSIISALYLKMENKDRKNRQQYLKERNLGLMGIYSRISFLLSYATMCMVFPIGVAYLAGIHWFSVVIWLLSKPPTGYIMSATLIILEAILHVFQYTTWSPTRDQYNTIGSLALSNFFEWIIFSGGLVWICITPVERPEFVMYKVGYGTHFFLFIIAFFILIRFYIRVRRSN